MTPDRLMGVREGDVLAGKYRIDKILVGGMGVVVAARHIELDEKVAIKFLRTRPRVVDEEHVTVSVVREVLGGAR